MSVRRRRPKHAAPLGSRRMSCATGTNGAEWARLGRDPVVVPQQASQPLPADHLTVRIRTRRRRDEWRVTSALMRPLLVVVREVLPHNVVKVFGPEDDELIQALLPDRLHEPLDV